MLKRMLKIFFFLSVSCIFSIPLWAEEAIHRSHAISFTFPSGHSIKKGQLEKALGVKNKSFYQFWKEDSPHLDDDLIETLEVSLKKFYASEGFYDAAFTLKENNTSIQVKINENEPIRIKSIHITSDYRLSSLVDFKEKSIFKASHFIKIKRNIIKHLRKEGYCSYDLDSKAYVDLDTRLVSIEYNLSKGGICTFGALSTSGLKSIDEKVIHALLRAKKGENFNTERIQESANNFYGLDAFDSVLIHTDKKIYNVIPVDIVFKEKENPYHFEVGAGYDTYVGYRMHTELTKYNFLGNAQKMTLKAEWSKKEQLLDLDYFKPVFLSFFDYYFDVGGNIGYSNLTFDGFQEEKSFAKAYIGYHSSKIKLNIGVNAEKILITNLDNLQEGEVLEQAVNAGNFVLFYPYINFVYDARNSKLNPKYGYYFSAYSEIGLSDEEDASSYLKTLLEGRLIYTWKQLTLSSVGRIGIIDENTKNSLPESKYFFGGGAYSNRAYGYQELGVIVSPTQDSIYGASSLLNLSLEMNYPVWGDIYGAVFSDNTMLNEARYDFSGKILSSLGVGARYMTPIGPFKLDVGVNSHDVSQYGISFQIGQSF